MGRVFLLLEYPVISLSPHIPTYSCNHDVTHMGTLSRIPTSVYLIPFIDNLSHSECKTQISCTLLPNTCCESTREEYMRICLSRCTA